MGTIRKENWDDDEYAVIGDKGDIGFIDFEDYKSVCNYNSTAEEGPVIISSPFPFVRGKPQSVLVGETAKCFITLENTTSESVELWAIRIYCSNPADSFTLSLMEPPSANSDVETVRRFVEAYSLEDRVLEPHDSLKIWLSCKPKEMGLHTTVVFFDVDNDRIERVAFLLADDKVSQSLAPIRPHPRNQQCRRSNFVKDHVVPSRRSRGGPQGRKYKLPDFDIPMDAIELLKKTEIPDVLTRGLSMSTYASFFSTLLTMEELHLKEDMKCFNMERVSMKREGAFLLALEVPGLAERRPSLVHGDHVFVRLSTGRAPNNTVYQGHIHRVGSDVVLLKFSKDLLSHHQNWNLYNVQFTYNRVNMRRLYQAIEAAQNLEPDFLFPSQSTERRLITAEQLVPFSSNLNEEQRRSVEMILRCQGAPPYVIFGPPGTGKTTTLVEAILQLYATRKNSRILVCTASNSVADCILEKLISHEVAEVRGKEVFRLNATSRPYKDVGHDLIRFCYFEDSTFRCPPIEALELYRIIICTYMSSSLLHEEAVGCGHFSHIFLDEASQVSEPECMVPISNLYQSETVVVLAGDPKQLGPVIFSRDAGAFGLGKSYLERLFEREPYYNKDELYITKLFRNYRCHPAILDLPSKLYNDGELIACKDDATSSISSELGLFPGKGFPVQFIGILGCDEREHNSPSWFNRIEASKVVEVIKNLTANTSINETGIGVITPYRLQVQKIKTVLQTWDMSDVKVGSVEQFDGQEREVVIISTVRSTVKHNNFDKTYCLGFFGNPKRFNVAITRARSLLIVVGNPHIVNKDPCWHKLLWYCADNDSYRGCPLPERHDDDCEL